MLMMKNLPNQLTFLRLAFVPVGISLLLINLIPFNELLAALVFVVGMFTDVLDGYIARKYNLITKLGMFLDPLADKLMILLYFVVLQSQGIYPVWLFLLFITRELLVDGFRSFSAGNGIFVAANIFGKTKAFLQTVSIIFGLLYLMSAEGNLIISSYQVFKPIAFWVMLISLIFSLIGMNKILINNSSIFKK